ncbi:MAG: alkaline phosphatase D family protein, partial [Acidobacteriota bacterium]|nr:alkaline phosphatase D family protein [Acidobacteriota bacterium]
NARARWPFVAIWDNGEFSDKGWQGLQRFGGVTSPAQTRKVAANQAWFEYMPALVRTTDGSLAAFAAPKVENKPVQRFDSSGLGQEANNLAAIKSLTGYRKIRWGKHVDLILTDQRSYRSEDYTAPPEASALSSTHFPQMVPFESLQMIDAGSTWPGGAPATLQFADKNVNNFRKGSLPRTLLGSEQKEWFLQQLAMSKATWKLWANTVATFDMRADPQNLPEGMTVPWPGEGYAGFARTDHSTTYAERADIYSFVQRHQISGFATLSGDRHSFWAGLSAAQLPPRPFEPVGVNFVVGSISSPGMVEAFEYTFPKVHPLRALYLVDRPNQRHPEPSMNLLFRHGVRTCLDYAEHQDLSRAKALSNPNNAPHVEFVDMGGHGYGVVTVSAERMDVEFVCIPRPVEPNAAPDGGPLRYRVVHSAMLWDAGNIPVLSRTKLEGDPELSG